MGYTLIIIGLICAATGCWIITKSKPTVENIVDNTKDNNTANSEPAQDYNLESSAEVSEAEKKGQDFEKFAISLFNKESFRLKEWRSDKYHNGRYAESNRYPDIVMELQLQTGEYPFAIECKWRKDFYKGSIEWATEKQIEIYNTFATERGIPVFVMIGIGGEPNAPESVYIAPLSSLKYPHAKTEYLEKFKREKSDKGCFFDYKKKVLF